MIAIIACLPLDLCQIGQGRFQPLFCLNAPELPLRCTLSGGV